jgi:hypothetical protein
VADLWGQQAEQTAQRRLGIYAHTCADVLACAPDADPEQESITRLQAELNQAATVLTTRFNTIGAYDGLSATDQVWFDIAVGLMAAMRMIDAAFAAFSSGTILDQEGDEHKRFSPLPSVDEQQKWSQELATALSFRSAVATYRQNFANQIQVLHIAGRTRQRECRGLLNLPDMVKWLLPSGWGGNRQPFAGVSDGPDALTEGIFI